MLSIMAAPCQPPQRKGRKSAPAFYSDEALLSLHSAARISPQPNGRGLEPSFMPARTDKEGSYKISRKNFLYPLDIRPALLYYCINQSVQ